MDSIKEIINWLDGKKTTIGGIVAFVAGGLFYSGVIDQQTFDSVMKVSTFILAIGLSHKVIKNVN